MAAHRNVWNVMRQNNPSVLETGGGVRVPDPLL